MIRLAYYPGCTLKDQAKGFEDSAHLVAGALGLELVELQRWTCCGTVHSLATDDVMHQLAPIRNLLRAQEMKGEGLVDDDRLVTLCAMCYNTLKRANSVFQEDEERREKIVEIMTKEEHQYQGRVKVVHLLEVLRGLGWQRVREAVKKPLEGLRVAPYYGCLLLRPRGVGLDDTDNPTIMENMVQALGGEVVDFPYKQKCCGSYQTVHMPETVSELAHRILSQAQEMGAELLVTACPLCEYNLGRMQDRIARRHPGFQPIPVIYFTQLMALAFGLGPGEAGFSPNTPDPTPLLEERGLLEG